MNRRSFIQCSFPLLLLPKLATATAAEPKKGKSSMYRIPLLQTIEQTAVRHKAWVNGFGSDLLISVRSDQKRNVAGLKTSLASYCALHPYFLKHGPNEVRAEYALNPSYMTPDDQGPWRLEYRVASMEYRTGEELGTTFPEKELLRLASPPLAKNEESAKTKTLSGVFTWSDGPEWSWTKSKKIENTPANRKSLQAAVQSFWDELNGMSGKAVQAELAHGVRTSIHEFIQASELRGKRFTFLDELLETASKGALPGDKTPEEFLREREQLQKGRGGPAAPDDEQLAHPPVARTADGKLPPRVSLRKLDSFDALEMSLLGDGGLARLTGVGGESVIQFVSNYRDGSRGAPGETRLKCDLWFRKNAKEQWEVDAIYPTATANLGLNNSWPQELFELQPY
jgi:hypothetical protein